MVGATRIELATSRPPGVRATTAPSPDRLAGILYTNRGGMKSRGGLRLFAGFLFRLFNFGFFGVVETVRVDVDGEPIFDGFNVFDEEVFENDGEADDDEEGGEDNFPGDVPAENVLCGEEQDDAEGEHEEAAEFEPFRAEAH